jgi:geranylgeranyl diphosphate synthase type II
MAYKGSAESYLQETSKKVNKYLELHLPAENGYAGQLIKSMRYSIFAGGKRVRPAMALASFEVSGGKGDSIFLATSALEMIHTFSLIHDDLPCMDNDDFRRGSPTNHKIFGEATAVLAGDALCILAFQLLGRTEKPQCVETLASALGTKGMLGGQMEDILAEGERADIERVNYIHLHKTAALIEASLVIGAQLADADDNAIRVLSEYGKKIGLAFQIVDDILDLEHTTEELGKDAGSDASKLKATYPAVIGVAESRKCANRLMNESIAALEPLTQDTAILKELAKFIVHRVN